MELKKYMDDIFELRKYYAHDNLENLISKKIPDLKKSQKFNIKMEVKRLANISSKTIDLRYILTDSTSVSFEYDGKVHYLDGRGLELFNHELKIYDGIYTEGVFERVMKDAKERLKVQKVKQELNTINFTERNPRQEERMNYTVKLNMFILSEQSPVGFKNFIDNPSGKPLIAVSLNISESGLKIKTKKDVKVEEDEVVFIEFQPDQLNENEESFFVPYQIIKIYDDRGTQNIAMKRVTAIPNYDFERNLRSFIEKSKDKYKIELTNIIDTAKAKSYEQAYVENMQSLPLYFSQNKLEYAYNAGKNDKIIRYFENEYGENTLSNVLEGLDVNVPNEETKRTSLYFMMLKIEKKEKIYFFAKSLASQNIELLKLFSMYGARRRTFRIFKLDIIKLEEEQYLNKNTLPEEVLQHVNFSNHFLTNEAKNKLRRLTSIGLLSDITDSDYKLNLSQMATIESNVNQLNKYRINVDDIKKINIIEDESKEIRKEDRFEVEELVTFKYKRMNFRAKTENISVNGMRITLERYSPILEGEKLVITFKNINNDNLVNIPYRVVNAFDMTLSLKLLKDETDKSPDEYFENYIRQNINNLTPVGIKSNIIGLSKGLRNMYVQNHLETPCFFKVSNEQISEYTLANSKATKQVFDKFNKKNNNIQKALYSDKFKESILEEYNNIGMNQSYTFKYFVKIISAGKDYIVYRQESDFISEKEKLDFLTNENTGKAFCFKITLNKTQGNFADRYFKDEIKYIEKYSNLKAEEVINEIERVSGILHIQNITEIKIRQLKLLEE